MPTIKGAAVYYENYTKIGIYSVIVIEQGLTNPRDQVAKNQYWHIKLTLWLLNWRLRVWRNIFWLHDSVSVHHILEIKGLRTLPVTSVSSLFSLRIFREKKFPAHASINVVRKRNDRAQNWRFLYPTSNHYAAFVRQSGRFDAKIRRNELRCCVANLLGSLNDAYGKHCRGLLSLGGDGLSPYLEKEGGGLLLDEIVVGVYIRNPISAAETT